MMMDKSRSYVRTVVILIRWIARITGSLLLFLLLAFLIGEGCPPIFGLPLPESLMLFAGIVVLLGILIAWKWEGVGGAMIVGGMLAFYAINHLVSGRFPGGALPLFYLPGILFLLCWWQTRRHPRQP